MLSAVEALCWPRDGVRERFSVWIGSDGFLYDRVAILSAIGRVADLAPRDDNLHFLPRYVLATNRPAWFLIL